MALLSVANVAFAHGDRIILDGVNLTLDAGQRVGLVGRNGCGKSTLMKMIAGIGGYKPDTGQIQVARGMSVGYLSQEFAFASLDRTLRDEAATAFERLHALHDELNAITHEMTEATGDVLDKLLKKYEEVERQVNAAGGYAVDHLIDQTLHGLGIEDERFNVPVKGLSGGQKGRLALAKLLLSKPDILLLDEPTNHLDIAGRQWLEEFLTEYPGAVIVVSHDRWLLDHSVNRICEIEEGKIVDYPGNYQAFRHQRAERRLAQQRAFEKQQDNFKKEQAFIDRYRAGQRAKQAQGRQTRLERMKKDQTLDRPIELEALSLSFRPGSRPGDLIVTADDIAKSYGQLVLFKHVSMVLQRGARVGIIGPNGAGKSTLVACLLGQIPADAGTVKVGPSINVGHYRQTHEHLPSELSIVEYLRQFVKGNLEQLARNLAGAFMFSGRDQDKMISVLSGGERSRCVLATLMVGGHNVLVLDEPTNHLDIPSAERLEFALMQFTGADREVENEDGEQVLATGYGNNAPNPGTLMLISHDRMLLDNLCDQLIVFDGHGNVRHFTGSYSEFVEAQQASATTSAPASNKDKEKSKSSDKDKDKDRDRKASNSGSQQSSKSSEKKSTAPGPKPDPAMAKLSQEALEKRIVLVESQLAELDKQLADPAVYRDANKVRMLQGKRGQLASELAPLEAEWNRRG